MGRTSRTEGYESWWKLVLVMKLVWPFSKPDRRVVLSWHVEADVGLGRSPTLEVAELFARGGLEVRIQLVI